MQDWYKISEEAEHVHWIKLRGFNFMTAACGKILPIGLAVRIESERTALAQQPGKFIERPEYGVICPDCERKVIEQA
jgi:hypothetical protein